MKKIKPIQMISGLLIFSIIIGGYYAFQPKVSNPTFSIQTFSIDIQSNILCITLKSDNSVSNNNYSFEGNVFIQYHTYSITLFNLSYFEIIISPRNIPYLLTPNSLIKIKGVLENLDQNIQSNIDIQYQYECDVFPVGNIKLDTPDYGYLQIYSSLKYVIPIKNVTTFISISYEFEYFVDEKNSDENISTGFHLIQFVNKSILLTTSQMSFDLQSIVYKYDKEIYNHLSAFLFWYHNATFRFHNISVEIKQYNLSFIIDDINYVYFC